LSLPFFMEFNYQLTNDDCHDKRGANAVKERIDKIMDVLNLNMNNIRNGLKEFFSSIGINLDIHSLIKGFEPETIISNVNIERLSNNPRKVSKKDIIEFLK
jgi:alcohol dehydrogenase class IV